MSHQDAQQQAIEDYLDELLQDDAQPVVTSGTAASAAAFLAGEEDGATGQSLQERQLRGFMTQAAQQVHKPAAPSPILDFDEAPAVAPVIMPNWQLVDEVRNTQADVAVEPQLVAETPAVQPPLAEEMPAPAATVPVIDEQQPPAPPGWKNGRPLWAQDTFECLLFKVQGLTLAVPLIELGGIIKIDREPTPLFGQPDWFIGMLRSNDMNVALVDTAQWVLPRNLLAQQEPTPYQLVIRIHESYWGLACHQVDRSISLRPDQVRWRTSLGKRPWLAGTVIEQMCALIDAKAFDQLLKQGHGELEPINLQLLQEEVDLDRLN